MVKPKRKVKHGSTPKRKRDDELLLITVNNYDKYQPYMDELKRRGITHENVGERLEEVKELRPLPAQCRKEGGECL
ncbi:MAG: hypothetical protein IJU81_05505 [Bacteroidales bacterium]|nr:hypothetical protein [Bacteroidales bacterium]